VYSHILSLGAYTPERIMSNDEVARMVDTSDDWIYNHTGIKNRRIADKNQAASDLGVLASQDAIKNAKSRDSGFDPGSIDLVLCATSTPDYPSFPATANIIQDKLGLKNAGAMDIAAACTGFIYGLETAKAYVESGLAKTVLVVGTEVYSRIVNWKDRSTCVLFGDGAGAAIVSVAPEGSKSHLGRGFLRSKGSGAEYLIRPSGGSRNPFIPGVTATDDLYIQMNGRQVYIFAVQALTEAILQTCKLNNLSFSDLDWVIPHQANRRIIEAACERAEWDIAKFHLNMAEFANTSAASIPIAAAEMVSKGLLKRGHKIATVGFGGGLTYGGNFFIY